MSDPKPWNKQVAAVLQEAALNDWLAEPAPPAECGYDPVTKRITSSVPIDTLTAQDMLSRGEAYIDAAGKFVLVDGDPLPPEERTTHEIRITVRQMRE